MCTHFPIKSNEKTDKWKKEEVEEGPKRKQKKATKMQHTIEQKQILLCNKSSVQRSTIKAILLLSSLPSSFFFIIWLLFEVYFIQFFFFFFFSLFIRYFFISSNFPWHFLAFTTHYIDTYHLWCWWNRLSFVYHSDMVVSLLAVHSILCTI